MAKRPTRPKAAAKRKPVATSKTSAKRKPAAGSRTTATRQPVEPRPAVRRKPAAKRKPARARTPRVTAPRAEIPPPSRADIATPAEPATPKPSRLSRWWPLVAIVLMVAAVVAVAIVRFTGSDGADPADQGFAADFPTEPAHTTSSFSFAGRLTTTEIFTSQTAEDTVGVGVTPLPSGIDADIKSVLDAVARTSVAPLGYTIKAQRHFTIGDDQALDITATGGPKIVYRSRFIHHAGKLYQLIGIGTSGHVTSAYAPFVASFRFT